MAQNDIRIKEAPYAHIPVYTFQTEAAATAIKAGEFVKWKTNGSPYVIPLADAEPVIGTTTAIVGLAKSDSTQTSAADGTVEVYLPLPGVVYEIKAKTASTADTITEINAAVGDRLLIDLTGTSYTIDVAGGEVQTSGFCMVGGDPDRASVYVTLRSGATFLGDQDLS